MKQEKQNRICPITVHLTSRELDHIDTRWHQSVCRKRSEYVRKLLLGKPVTVRHRNQSLDDLMATLIPLRSELNSIDQNYKEVVGKLHLLRNLGQIDTWLREHEAAWATLHLKITEIKTIISQIDDQWLQS